MAVQYQGLKATNQQDYSTLLYSTGIRGDRIGCSRLRPMVYDHSPGCDSNRLLRPLWVGEHVQSNFSDANPNFIRPDLPTSASDQRGVTPTEPAVTTWAAEVNAVKVSRFGLKRSYPMKVALRQGDMTLGALAGAPGSPTCRRTCRDTTGLGAVTH